MVFFEKMCFFEYLMLKEILKLSNAQIAKAIGVGTVVFWLGRGGGNKGVKMKNFPPSNLMLEFFHLRPSFLI